MVTDALGDPIKLETVKEARDGEDVQLTLDPVIQQKAEQVLAKVGETYSPKGATAIVMDPETSEILAMANWPPVNPGDLENVSNEDLTNRATSFNYEPGSTFKAFTVSAALEEGLVTPSTEFTLPPEIEVGERWIHDAEERGTETLTVAQILARSSNVGAVEIGLRRSARRNSANGSKNSASASRPGSSSRARKKASCRSSTNTRARRWATCRWARAPR